jgi:hypothetical protein
MTRPTKPRAGDKSTLRLPAIRGWGTCAEGRSGYSSTLQAKSARTAGISPDSRHTTDAFSTLRDVVNYYDDGFSIGLSTQENTDLVEFLKSLPPANI